MHVTVINETANVPSHWITIMLLMCCIILISHVCPTSPELRTTIFGILGKQMRQ